MIPIQTSSLKSDLEIPSLPTLVLLLSPLMLRSVLDVCMVQTHQVFTEAVLILTRHYRPRPSLEDSLGYEVRKKQCHLVAQGRTQKMCVL